MQYRDVLQTNLVKCRDTSITRIGTDFHWKNTDSSHENVACLKSLTTNNKNQCPL